MLVNFVELASGSVHLGIDLRLNFSQSDEAGDEFKQMVKKWLAMGCCRIEWHHDGLYFLSVWVNWVGMDMFIALDDRDTIRWSSPVYCRRWGADGEWQVKSCVVVVAALGTGIFFGVVGRCVFFCDQFELVTRGGTG